MINCRTINENQKSEPVLIPIPMAPLKPHVEFEDIKTGLFLSYENGKKLAIYLEELESYQKHLITIIEYNIIVDNEEKIYDN